MSVPIERLKKETCSSESCSRISEEALDGTLIKRLALLSKTGREPTVTLPFHPCLHPIAHHSVPRLHLPVAPRCNISCGYCERKVLPGEESIVAPGISSTILSPWEALAKTGNFLDKWGQSAVVGVAGPGEPLANESTFKALRLIREHYSETTLCICTNGLVLPERCNELRDLGVKYLTVTINGFDPLVVAQIQSTVIKDGRVYKGKRAADVLIRSQVAGLKAVVRAGMTVKVNCVIVPDINGAHVTSTAQKVRELGALVFNPIPLIPRGLFAKKNRPDDRYMARLRSQCSNTITVFSHCKQCRADAEGIPGKEKAG